VRTSLIEPETKPKNCFILKVKDQKFMCKPIPLKCVRSFTYRHISLKQSGIDPRRTNQIEEFIKRELDDLIELANKEGDLQRNRKEIGKAVYEELRLPFVRLRLDYSDGYSIIKSKKIDAHVLGRIANPADYLSFFKQRDFDTGQRKELGRGKGEYLSVREADPERPH